MWKVILSLLRRWGLVGRKPDVGQTTISTNDCELGPEVPNQSIDAGSGNLQVGIAHGDVVSHVNHHTQHISHITIIQASSGPPSPVDPIKPTSSEQSAVLRRMDQLRSRITVLNFMEREFGTRMVIHLRPDQLNRVHLYLDAVMRNPEAIKSERQTKKRA